MTVAISNMYSTFANTTIRYDAIGMDVNTFAYASGSNLINLKKNGTSQFVVDANGRVGIGTTNPRSLLDVAGTLTVDSIELGNGNDTTISRISAGNVAIEGNIIYRADGTDVPVADGGTGASNAANARINILGSSYTLANIVYLTSGTNTTYTPRPNTRALYVEVVGGGGGGGSANGVSLTAGGGGRGGGGGGYAARFITNTNQTFTYTVGAGGAGGPTTGTAENNGTTGGTTTFFGGTGTTALVQATGGNGGTFTRATTTNSWDDSGGAGGNGTEGDIIIRGGRGAGRTTGTWSSVMIGGRGGSSMFSFGALATQATGGTTDPGNNSEGFGGGGGGGAVYETTDNAAGGSGSDGLIKIWEYL